MKKEEEGIRVGHQGLLGVKETTDTHLERLARCPDGAQMSLAGSANAIAEN